MIFDFKIIPHKKHRYETPGDYFKRFGIWRFRVSRMKDERYPWLIFLHEIIEWSICRLNRIPMKAIDKFDVAYEESRTGKAHGFRHLGRAPCGCDHYDEPGDDPHAPYHSAHQVASKCERIIADGLGVDWSQYNDVVEKL